MTGHTPHGTGDVAVLRGPRSSSLRYGTFLAAWLAIWAVMQAAGIAALIAILLTAAGQAGDGWFATLGESLAARSVTVALASSFLWLALWTWGGASAAWQLLRVTAGSDSVRITPQGIEVTRRAGPLRWVRRVGRPELTRLRTRDGDHALVAHTRHGAVVISDLGTAKERVAVGAWLRERLNIAAAPPPAPVDLSTGPPGWRLDRDSEGQVRLVRHGAGRKPFGLVLWLVTAAAIAAWLLDTPDRTWATAAAAVVIALVILSAWVTWAREEWIVRTGRVLHRTRFGPWAKEQRFEGGTLAVVPGVDSEGDFFHRLVVRDAAGARTFDRAASDPLDLMDAARWLAAATRFPIDERK